MTTHPAKFPPAVIAIMSDMVTAEAKRIPKRRRRLRVLDCFAGTGRCHQLPGLTFGIELEKEWADMHPRTQVGDATALPWRANSFDICCTSPTWGNRLADHHDAKDGSVRHSYTHDLGRKLSDGNSGTLRFANDPEKSGPYRKLHRKAWAEVARVLRPGALMILDCSDFFAQRERQYVTGFHVHVFEELGFTVEDVTVVPTPRLRYGANRQRVEGESIIQLRGPATGVKP